VFGGRIYTLTWDADTAITAANDNFEIVPASGKPVFIHEWRIWNTTDLGDAAEETLRVSIRRGYTVSGSGGGTTVVGKKYVGDAAISATTEIRNTTLANTGTPDIQMQDGWNVRVPFLWTPTPPHLLPFTASERLVCRIDSTPADTITIGASLIIEELG
jgi:hypothetical protein